ncbi:Ger(x)C family spore germination protein [Metabacillus indicus]|uniref:Ger(x)C family spore germination protein n=1 Tax=Metabacillus indicus TaxID=246786 RepID=UPI002491C23A|nr:Ger(x)C family spore germination protein [Metabacillus indicus]
MNKLKTLCLAGLSVLLLSGCWDQKLLKNTVFMSATAFQVKSEDEVLVTTSIHTYTTKEQRPVNKTYSVVAKSTRDSKIKLNQEASGFLMTAKNKVFLLQDDLAKKGLLQFADVLYRTPESPLNGKFIIVEKDPKAILELQKVGDELIGENLAGLIKTMEFESAVPTETIQSICTVLFDEGKGLMLPYMKLNESNQAAEITGAALFHKDKYTGVTINTDQTKLLLALSNKRNKAMMINDTIPFKDEQLTVSYEISHSKGNLKIEKDGLNKVKVKLPFKAELDIMEFPHDRLYEKSVLENLQKGIEKKLQQNMEETISIIQEANCDYLGIGRELIAYHPEMWKKLDWEKDYPEISIEPEVSVEIVHHGIIN